jgi:thiol:disulfide interchange protein
LGNWDDANKDLAQAQVSPTRMVSHIRPLYSDYNFRFMIIDASFSLGWAGVAVQAIDYDPDTEAVRVIVTAKAAALEAERVQKRREDEEILREKVRKQREEIRKRQEEEEEEERKVRTILSVHRSDAPH